MQMVSQERIPFSVNIRGILDRSGKKQPGALAELSRSDDGPAWRFIFPEHIHDDHPADTQHSLSLSLSLSLFFLSS